MQDQWEEAYPGFLGKLMKGFALATGRDPEQGAYSALYSALSDEVIQKDYNGYYLNDPVSESTHSASSLMPRQGQPGKETQQGQDVNLATALWELSERMVKRIVGQDALESWSK